MRKVLSIIGKLIQAVLYGLIPLIYLSSFVLGVVILIKVAPDFSIKYLPFSESFTKEVIALNWLFILFPYLIYAGLLIFSIFLDSLDKKKSNG